MSAAEDVRAAAARIREVATAATAGPWIPGQGPGTGNVFVDGVEHLVADMPACSDHPDMQQVDAEHIAMWHPGVALAVASALEEKADDMDATRCDTCGKPHEVSYAGQLAIARAINGGKPT